jgi:hypothetical protein
MEKYIRKTLDEKERGRGVRIARKVLKYWIDHEQDKPDPEEGDPVCSLFMNGLWNFPLAVKMATLADLKIPPTESLLKSNSMMVGSVRRADNLEKHLDEADEIYAGVAGDTKAVIAVGLCDDLSDMILFTRDQGIENFDTLPFLRFRLSDKNCWMFKLSEYAQQIIKKYE